MQMWDIKRLTAPSYDPFPLHVTLESHHLDYICTETYIENEQAALDPNYVCHIHAFIRTIL